MIDTNGTRITSVPLLVPLGVDATRLLFRVRAYFPPRHHPFGLLFDVGDFVFMRKMMLGIKSRAERPVEWH